MKNNFFIKNRLKNIYEKSSKKSPISSQIIYGERFKIISKNKNWLKIKTSFDNYIGYVNNIIYIKKFKPTHKIYTLKTKIFKKPIYKKSYETNLFLTFASKISIIRQYNGFVEYEKNRWIKKKDVKKITSVEKNYLKILKLFLKTQYLWGGKSYQGIDCSAILQLIFFYNGKFYPRDTKDQIKYSIKNIKRKNFKKGDIIFWKGHVAICINSKQLIHAFGPRKKVILMNIQKTIIEIRNNSKLNIICKKNINDF